MADLDLLVPQNRWSEAVERLEQIGYRIHASEYPDPHEVALLRDDVPGAVEVHGRIGDPRLMAVMPAEDLWRASSPLSVGATTARAPSPTDQVLHCVLHAGVQDEHHVFGDLPLRQLLTLARLLEAEQGAVEWEELARRASEHGHERVVRAYVALAHELLGAPVPSGWTEDWRSRAHRRRVLTCFLLRWPSTLPRNVRDALERDRLDTLYHHGNRPVPLAWARLRHLVRTLRSRGWAASRDEALKSPS